jgi:hypothetical protein
MPEITRRKTVTYRWICTDKERCEQIDEAIKQLVFHASQLSAYVANKEITGLECLVLDGKFKIAVKELRKERAMLWRRVRRETEEEIITENGEVTNGLERELRADKPAGLHPEVA